MFHLHYSSPRKLWIFALAPLALFDGSASAQDFTTRVGNPNPLGIGSFVPTGSVLDTGLGIKGNFKGQFLYGVGANTVYNSNFFLSEDDEEGEVTLQASPWISYLSDPEGGAPISLTANYTPNFQAFVENSDLNGADHTADFTLRLMGSRSEISLFGSFAQASATDELTREFVNGSLFTGGFRASRQIASRTSMSAGWSFSMSDYGTANIEGAQIHTGYVGGLWAATERFGVGSTLRYSLSQSDTITDQGAWALLLDARYQASERIWLSASLGPQFTEDSGSGSSIGLAGDAAARYIINERWSWTNSLLAVTVPSPSEAEYVVNDITFSTGLQRALVRGSIGAGLEFRLSLYEEVGDATSAPDDEQNVRMFLNYGRPLFSERLGFNSRVSYAFNNGESDWTRLEVSMGLNVAF